jgi:hypothetical protein
MAGDWIKIERDLPHKPEVMRMAESLGIDELQVVGHLVLFWSWCDANMSLDCPDVIGTKRGLDRASCRDGMVDALLSVGWLELVTDFGQECYRIPNFERHLSKSAKTRATEQRKKQQQRSRPKMNGDKCPEDNGTKMGPEKRREEKRENYIPGPDVVIPEAINTLQFREAIGRWIIYTRSSAKINGKPIESNSMEEQELWRMVSTWKTDAESLSEAVSAAIVGGWANLRRPAAAKPHTHTKFTKFSEEFLEAVKAAQRYPSDYETRQQVLGAEKFEALKRTGTAKVANATDSQLTSLGEIFDSHLRDIRQELRV